MRHAAFWDWSDWQYALDTAELAASAFQEGVKVGVLSELRLREKQKGTTWSVRSDMRIRYVTRVDMSDPSASLTSLDQFRHL